MMGSASRTGRDGSDGSGENSPRLTYSAIADNPEGEERRKRETEGGRVENKK